MTRRFHSLSAAAVLATTATLGLAAAAVAPAQAATCSSTLMSAVRLDAATYADRLVRAWGRGDAFATNCYATGTVANYLRAQASPGGIHWSRTSTDGAAGTSYVTYKDLARGGTLTIGVHNVGLRESDGWHAAYTARFSNEPVAWGPVAWADNLIRAWGRGDHPMVSYYATSSVASTLFHYRSPGGTHWARVASQGAAGTTFVTYRDTVTGHHVTVGVSNVGLSQGDAHAAYTVKIS